MLTYQYRDPHLKIRRSCDRLIFNMGIPIPGKMVFMLFIIHDLLGDISIIGLRLSGSGDARRAPYIEVTLYGDCGHKRMTRKCYYSRSLHIYIL